MIGMHLWGGIYFALLVFCVLCECTLHAKEKSKVEITRYIPDMVKDITNSRK